MRSWILTASERLGLFSLGALTISRPAHSPSRGRANISPLIRGDWHPLQSCAPYQPPHHLGGLPNRAGPYSGQQAVSSPLRIEGRVCPEGGFFCASGHGVRAESEDERAQKQNEFSSLGKTNDLRRTDLPHSNLGGDTLAARAEKRPAQTKPSRSFAIISKKTQRYRLLLISILTLLLAGCGTAVKFRKEVPLYDKETGKIVARVPQIAPSLKAPKVGERLTYAVKWMSINVGTITLSVEEIVEIGDRQAYHLLYQAQTNRFFSTFYKVKDNVHSFVDVKDLLPVRFEKHLREGRYRCDEVIEYDHTKQMATCFASNVVKANITIPQKIQDVLSCLYYFRLQDVEIGKSVFMDVNAGEKNWQVEVKIIRSQRLQMPAVGSRSAFMVEVFTKFRGRLIQKGRMWIWFSADSDRVPFIAKTKVPFGTIVAVLKKAESL